MPFQSSAAPSSKRQVLVIACVLTVICTVLLAAHSTAATGPTSKYWDDLSWSADSATVRHTLEARGYYFAGEAIPGVNKYVGKYETDLRVAFAKGRLVRVSGLMKDSPIEPHVRVLLAQMRARFGAPDSVIRNGKRLLADSASRWESWNPALAVGFLWRKKAGRADLSLWRKPDSGTPMLMLMIESSSYDPDELLQKSAQRAQEYIASHEELDEPLLLADQAGPLGPGWTLLSGNKAPRVSVLRPFKRQADGSYLTWMRFDYLVAQEDGIGRRMFRTYADCRRHRYRISHASVFDTEGNSTVRGEAVDGPGEWHTFIIEPKGTNAISDLCLLISKK